MKLPQCISHARRQAGILLVECLVYIAVFTILLGIGTAAFYFCWDHTQSVIYATEDIASALHAGECWRADVRDATGKISVESTAAGELVRIHGSENEVVYHFESGEVRREIPALKRSRLLLPKVRISQMLAEPRGSVRAWRWELELKMHRKETHLPLLFTFEAVQTKP
jgi:hypothetical protein